MIATGPTFYDALNAALTKLPSLWKHDLEFTWRERTKVWEVRLVSDNSQTSLGIASKSKYGSGKAKGS